jgi:hypothetical protein
MGVQTCYYPAYGNVSENNQFSGNGSFGNPTNGDIGLATAPHKPGNCFSGDSVPDRTDPAVIETNPPYQPTNGMCTNANSGDETVLAAEVACAGQIFAACPNAPGANYPWPAPVFPLSTAAVHAFQHAQPVLGCPQESLVSLS